MSYFRNQAPRDTELHDPFTSNPVIRRAAVRQLLGNHANNAPDALLLLEVLGLTPEEGKPA